MVVFGGIDATKRLNDMWLYDIGTPRACLLVRCDCPAFCSHPIVAAGVKRMASGSRPSALARAPSRLLRSPIQPRYGTALALSLSLLRTHTRRACTQRATEDGEYLYLFGGQRWWGYQGIINLVPTP
jgi:hypothetical protein